MKTYSDGIVTALILEKGEAIHENLKQAAKRLGLPGGFITGIGAVEDVIIGYFDKGSRAYIEKR